MKGLVLVASLSVADLLTAAIAFPIVGVEMESNPIMVAAYVRYGLGMMALVKALLAIVLLLLVARVRDRSRTLAIAIAVGITGAGVASNLLGIFVR